MPVLFEDYRDPNGRSASKECPNDECQSDSITCDVIEDWQSEKVEDGIYDEQRRLNCKCDECGTEFELVHSRTVTRPEEFPARDDE